MAEFFHYLAISKNIFASHNYEKYRIESLRLQKYQTTFLLTSKPVVIGVNLPPGSEHIGINVKSGNRNYFRQ